MSLDVVKGSPRPPLPPGPYLVVGIGRAGGAAARALATEVGATGVRAWDASLAREARAAARELEALGMPVHLGGDGLDSLDGVRTVVKSPGVRPDVPVLRAARERGIEIMDELELGWRLTRAPVIAVTGTNGKSTTAALLTTALAASGRDAVLAGNTAWGPPLSALAGPREGWIVAEVSSYQLAGAPAFLPGAAVFTNLSRDHVHWHGSMEAYADAKRRLFVRGSRAVPLAVLSADDPFGRRLAEEVAVRGGTAVTYGTRGGCDYRVASVATSSPVRATVVIETSAGAQTLHTRLPGAHNAMNLAAALALCDALRLPRMETAPALERTGGVPGRFEPVAAGHSFEVVVDFAHTPDGVEKTLETARALAAPRGGRVIAVLGVVARGDPTTRRQTAATARALADVLVLCASSMRGEPGLVLLSDLLAGARAVPGGGELQCVLDRGGAISRAIAQATPGDVVVIMGRGPMSRLATDARGGWREFDDREVARQLLLSA